MTEQRTLDAMQRLADLVPNDVEADKVAWHDVDTEIAALRKDLREAEARVKALTGKAYRAQELSRARWEGAEQGAKEGLMIDDVTRIAAIAADAGWSSATLQGLELRTRDRVAAAIASRHATGEPLADMTPSEKRAVLDAHAKALGIHILDTELAEWSENDLEGGSDD